MTLLRYGPMDREKPAVLDADGRIRDLSSIIADQSVHSLSLVHLQDLVSRSLDPLPFVPDGVRFGCPIQTVGKFIAMGLNSSDHAAETGHAAPKEPIIVANATSCIVGPNDPIMLRRYSVKTGWEDELGVVIGDTASYVTEDEALEQVAGYCMINDVSEREYQLERGGSWDKGTTCDTFGPIGPHLVTADEIGDPQKSRHLAQCDIERKQTGNTRTMIFPVKSLVSYISPFYYLKSGGHDHEWHSARCRHGPKGQRRLPQGR
jgi:2-keto-4-pentenoate hydratase/2-oxohepta-3-ene-1,7-dioic acid hydratase in catechol pathway